MATDRLRFVNPGAPTGGDGTTSRITAQHTLDNAAAVDKGGGEVGLPITGHSLIAGAEITITGTTNYDQSGIAINSVTANEIVITDTFVSETFAVTDTVDDDNVAYDGLSAAEAAEQTADADLVTGDETLTFKCAGTTVDGTGATIAGWTVGATNFITIKGDRDQSDGFYDGFLQYNTSFYHMEDSGAFTTLSSQIKFTVIDGIQIKSTKTGSFINAVGIGGNTVNEQVVKNCRLITALSGTDRFGVRSGSINPGDTNRVENCIIAGWAGASSGVVSASAAFFTGTLNIFNCTIYDCGDGIRANDADASSTLVAKNCCLFNNTDDFANDGSGTLTIDFCATEEGAGEGTNAQTITTPTDDMEDPENSTADSRDVRLKTTGVLEANGTTGGGIPTLDIIGTTRDGSTPDIGAWEIVAADASDIEFVGTLGMGQKEPVQEKNEIVSY